MPITAEEFFSSNSSPPGIEKERDRLRCFIAKHSKSNRRIVVVTSGGTAVTLEKRAVRHLDNFSTGHRGAASAESFIRCGCAVVFFSRPDSMQPFARCVKREGVLDSLTVDEGKVMLKYEDNKTQNDLIKSVKEYHEYREVLLCFGFFSIIDYLYGLKLLWEEIGKLSSVFYLPAAVADFYLPEEEQSDHKIHSRAGDLQLTLRGVPKLLPLLRRSCPRATIVSFKLETDLTILRRKATRAINDDGVDMVVANELTTRYLKVIVFPAGEEPLELHATQGESLEPAIIDLVIKKWNKRDSERQ